ncbi:MAG TPA: phosphoenolpyruvate--protein phosphotransferase, partial [Candidatus Limnocylindria bacterium]
MASLSPTVDQSAPAIDLVLYAPLSGVLVPVERVPDPVFAQKMAGDGIAVDPTSQSLLAPCDGEVVQLHPAHHALALATAAGVEVMLHIGLDTINLKGQGFTPRVNPGDRVKAGDPLIDFDADYLATHAKSLLTMMAVTNGDRVEAYDRQSGVVTAGQDVALVLTLASGADVVPLKLAPPVTSEAILIPNGAGLHARPAAVLANLARQFTCDVWLQRGDARANAKSVVSLMSLDVRHDDKVTVVAQGPDAQAVIAALAPQIAQGLGEEGTPAPAPASRIVAEIATPAPAPRSGDPDLLLGVTASPGLAVGTVFQVRHQELEVAQAAEDPEAEERKLDAAIEQARRELEALQVQLHGQADADKAAIFAAHQEILDDPVLRATVRSAILKGSSAAFAWQRVVNAQADQLAALHNQVLAARAADLRDVGQRVLMSLTGAGPRRVDAPADSILIAEDLTPSDAANLDRGKVLGFATTLGSATSHVAILARAMDLPAVAGVEPRALDLPDGTPVILDGSNGTLRLNPSADELDRLRVRQQRLAARRRADLEQAPRPAVTTDGHTIEVVANIGGLLDAREALSLGGEGVGLLRTEFLFLDRNTAPTEDEQARVYAEIAQEMGPDRRLVIRTLDVGGDKPLPYLPMPREENPFLGERGVRVGLSHPEVLRTQLRAVLRAADAGRLLLMFPMIATLTEWRAARAMFEEERARLGAPSIPVGIMVEIPAAAIMAEQFAREVDFL